MRLCLVLSLLPGLAAAEIIVPVRTIRAQQIIAPEDVMVLDKTVPGAVSDPADAIGQEARRALYANRPIAPADLGPPALVDRNQAVALAYREGPVQIVTEGRALSRGGLGDVIRVMNLSSRTTVAGEITAQGMVIVGLAP